MKPPLSLGNEDTNHGSSNMAASNKDSRPGLWLGPPYPSASSTLMSSSSYAKPALHRRTSLSPPDVVSTVDQAIKRLSTPITTPMINGFESLPRSWRRKHLGATSSLSGSSASSEASTNSSRRYSIGDNLTAAAVTDYPVHLPRYQFGWNAEPPQPAATSTRPAARSMSSGAPARRKSIFDYEFNSPWPPSGVQHQALMASLTSSSGYSSMGPVMQASTSTVTSNGVMKEDVNAEVGTVLAHVIFNGDGSATVNAGGEQSGRTTTSMPQSLRTINDSPLISCTSPAGTADRERKSLCGPSVAASSNNTTWGVSPAIRASSSSSACSKNNSPCRKTHLAACGNRCTTSSCNPSLAMNDTSATMRDYPSLPTPSPSDAPTDRRAVSRGRPGEEEEQPGSRAERVSRERPLPGREGTRQDGPASSVRGRPPLLQSNASSREESTDAAGRRRSLLLAIDVMNGEGEKFGENTMESGKPSVTSGGLEKSAKKGGKSVSVVAKNRSKSVVSDGKKSTVMNSRQKTASRSSLVSTSSEASTAPGRTGRPVKGARSSPGYMKPTVSGLQKMRNPQKIGSVSNPGSVASGLDSRTASQGSLIDNGMAPGSSSASLANSKTGTFKMSALPRAVVTKSGTSKITGNKTTPSVKRGTARSASRESLASSTRNSGDLGGKKAETGVETKSNGPSSKSIKAGDKSKKGTDLKPAEKTSNGTNGRFPPTEFKSTKLPRATFYRTSANEESSEESTAKRKPTVQDKNKKPPAKSQQKSTPSMGSKVSSSTTITAPLPTRTKSSRNNVDSNKSKKEENHYSFLRIPSPPSGKKAPFAEMEDDVLSQHSDVSEFDNMPSSMAMGNSEKQPSNNLMAPTSVTNSKQFEKNVEVKLSRSQSVIEKPTPVSNIDVTRVTIGTQPPTEDEKSTKGKFVNVVKLSDDVKPSTFSTLDSKPPDNVSKIRRRQHESPSPRRKVCFPAENSLIPPAAYHMNQQPPFDKFDAIILSLKKAAESVGSGVGVSLPEVADDDQKLQEEKKMDGEAAWCPNCSTCNRRKSTAWNDGVEDPYASIRFGGHQNNSVEALAAKLRANPLHLRDNCDYVEFWDLDQSHVDAEVPRNSKFATSMPPTDQQATSRRGLFAKNKKACNPGASKSPSVLGLSRFRKSRSAADFNQPVTSTYAWTSSKKNAEIHETNNDQFVPHYSPRIVSMSTRHQRAANVTYISNDLKSVNKQQIAVRSLSDNQPSPSVTSSSTASTTSSTTSSTSSQHSDDDLPATNRPYQRSLSLPKSFLSDRYGLQGFRAALPSLLFPWRKSGVDSGFQSTSSSSFPTSSSPNSDGSSSEGQQHRPVLVSPAGSSNQRPSFNANDRTGMKNFGEHDVADGRLVADSLRIKGEVVAGSHRAPTPYAIPVPPDFQRESQAFHAELHPSWGSAIPNSAARCHPLPLDAHGHPALRGTANDYRSPLLNHQGQHYAKDDDLGAFRQRGEGSTGFSGRNTSRPKSAIFTTSQRAMLGQHQDFHQPCPCSRVPPVNPGQPCSPVRTNNDQASLPYSASFPGQPQHQCHGNLGASKGKHFNEETQAEASLLQKFRKTFSWRFNSHSNSNSSSSARPRSSSSGPASLPPPTILESTACNSGTCWCHQLPSTAGANNRLPDSWVNAGGCHFAECTISGQHVHEGHRGSFHRSSSCDCPRFDSSSTSCQQQQTKWRRASTNCYQVENTRNNQSSTSILPNNRRSSLQIATNAIANNRPLLLNDDSNYASMAANNCCPQLTPSPSSSTTSTDSAANTSIDDVVVCSTGNNTNKSDGHEHGKHGHGHGVVVVPRNTSGASSGVFSRQRQVSSSGMSNNASKRLSGDSGIMMMCDSGSFDAQTKNRQSQSTSPGVYSPTNPSLIAGIYESRGSDVLLDRNQEKIEFTSVGATSSGERATPGINDEKATPASPSDDRNIVVSQSNANNLNDGSFSKENTSSVVEQQELRRPCRAAPPIPTGIHPGRRPELSRVETGEENEAMLADVLQRRRKVSAPSLSGAFGGERRSSRVYSKNKESGKRYPRSVRNQPASPAAALNPVLWRSSSQPSDLNAPLGGATPLPPPVSAGIGMVTATIVSAMSATAAAVVRMDSVDRRRMFGSGSQKRRTYRKPGLGCYSDDDVLRSDEEDEDSSSSTCSQIASKTDARTEDISSEDEEVVNAEGVRVRRRLRKKQVENGKSGEANPDEEDDGDHEDDDDEQESGENSKATNSSNDSGHHGSSESQSSGHNDQEFVEEAGIMLAEALWDHITNDAEELSFRAGDVIEVLDTSFQHWWWGELHEASNRRQSVLPVSRAGWFPAGFVRLRVSPEEILEEEDEDGSDEEAKLDGNNEKHESPTVDEKIVNVDPEPSCSSPPAMPRKKRLTTRRCRLPSGDPDRIVAAAAGHRPSTKSPPMRSRIGELRACEGEKGVKEQAEEVPMRGSVSSVTSLNRRSSMLISHDQVRGNIIKEIITSEKDFLKNLCDVKQGYLCQVRRRPDMFSNEHIATIFGNIEILHEFQSEFVDYLESKINARQPHKSCIGECFKKYRAGFRVYSEYCNNHPSAVALLQELYEDPKYCHFFEACRLLQKMIDISLDGFLLTPVQKICKYPLQLAELAKYTKADHSDYPDVLEALEEMRNVAAAVNESRRRRESLESLVKWEASIAGWEGGCLLDTSSMMIHQGDVFALKGSSPMNQKPKELTLFLFDHLLVYCRRDLLKKTTFIYRGRIPLDACRVMNCADGKDEHLGVTLKNAWKVMNLERNHYFLFYARSPEEKQEWLTAFAEERTQVRRDRETGIRFTEKDKSEARRAALASRNNKPKKPKGKPGKVKLDPAVMASFMRQMNAVPPSPHQHHTSSLSRVMTSGATLHYRNDVRYHSATSRQKPTNWDANPRAAAAGAINNKEAPPTRRFSPPVFHTTSNFEDETDDIHNKDVDDHDNVDYHGHRQCQEGCSKTAALDFQQGRKKSTWFPFGQKKSSATNKPGATNEVPNSTFYTPA